MNEPRHQQHRRLLLDEETQQHLETLTNHWRRTRQAPIITPEQVVRELIENALQKEEGSSQKANPSQ